MGEAVVEVSSPEDKEILESVGYPLIALTPCDKSKQREVENRYAPSQVSLFLADTFPSGVQGFLLLTVFIWGTVFPVTLLLDSIFLEPHFPIIGDIILYGTPILFTAISFFYSVILRFQFKTHQVTNAIQGLYYTPMPQQHTRGRKMLNEAYNISSQILSSYAWESGLARKDKDIRGEIISIIDEIMRIYDKDTREVENKDEELDTLQKRLDEIRHYARCEMITI